MVSESAGTVTPKEQMKAPFADRLEKRYIDWMWFPYLQRSAINLITGDPGSGKSTLACEIAARVSRGEPLPNGEAKAPANVWIMNGEDNAEDTIVWRLDNQGADLSRIQVTDRATAIDGRIAKEIEAKIVKSGISLLIIDPLQAWVGAGMDMNRANETRAWAGQLRDVAQRTGCAIVFVRHRRKGQPGDNSLYSGLGSIDITGLARSEVSVIKNARDECFVTRTKGNVGSKSKTLKYIVVPSADPLNVHGVLTWKSFDAAAEQAATGTLMPKKLGEAIEWLTVQLAGGPKSVGELLLAASDAKISQKTLLRAKKEVAESFQTKNGWLWRLATADGDELDQPEHELIGRRAA